MSALEIKNVIYNNPATIVFWSDGTKTVVKCGDYDVYDPEKGLAMAIAKKSLGNKYEYYETFKTWLPEEEPAFPNIKLALERAQSSLSRIFGTTSTSTRN